MEYFFIFIYHSSIPNKKTLILIKNGDYYEPIYTYEDKKTHFEITKLFDLRNPDILPNLKTTLIVLKNILNNKKINEDSSNDNTPQWDSLSYINIIVKVEKEFSVKINQKNFHKFNSFKNILRIINDK